MTEEEIRKRKEAANQYRNKTVTTSQPTTISTSSAAVSSSDLAARKNAANIARAGGDYSADRTAKISSAENMKRHGYVNDFNERRKEIAFARSTAYMNLSDTDRALMQLNSQVNAYKKAKDVFDKVSYSERNSTSKKSDSWQKSKNLVDNLKSELRTQYQSIYGVDADFDKWLGSAVLQGVNQFNVGLANTGAMAGNLIPSAINEATRYLKFGNDIGSTAQLRSAEELEKVKGSPIYGSLMGGWVNQYEKAIGKPDEEMRGWLSSYEKLKHRASELSAKGNFNEADIYNNRAQEFYDRISKKYENYLKSTGEFWSIPEGEDPLSEYAQMVNDVYARGQEEYEKQLEYQKMTASGSGKGYEIAGQIITSTVQALPYAGLALMTGGASLAQFVPEGHTLVNAATLSGSGIGAQLAPQTTDIIGKVSNILTSFGKDPQYWLSFAQEAGNTYKEAIDAGADSNVATLTATLVGLINGAIELGFGGGNAGIQDLPENLLKGKGAGTRRAIQEWIESALSEGKEEVLQGVISNLAEKIAYNKDKKWIGEGGVFDPQSLSQEGLMGAGVGALLGGGQIMGVNVMNQTVQNRIDQANARLGQRYSEQADTIIQNALKMPETTESYRLAVQMQNKDTRTDAQVGALYNAMMRDTGYYQTVRSEDISAVEKRLNELGETTNSRDVALAIADLLEGKKLSKAQRRTIQNSEYGTQVLKEYALQTAEWVQTLDKRVEALKIDTAPQYNEQQRTGKHMLAMIERASEVAPRKSVEQLSEKYGESATVFKEAAAIVDEDELYDFDAGFHTVYQLAKRGATAETIRKDKLVANLSPSAFQLAYDEGVKAGEIAASQRRRTGFDYFAAVKLHDNIEYKSLSNKQKASIRSLQRLARATGVPIVIFDSRLPNGKLGDIQGKYTKGTIFIDINAGMDEAGQTRRSAMLRTAGHEFTHYIQQNNIEAYNELVDAVLNKLQTTELTNGKYYSATEWILAKMEATGLGYDGALDEVIADACEMMLQNSTAMESLAKENPTLFQTFVDWLAEFIADIKRAFKGVEANSEEAKVLASDIDALEEIQKKWDAALVGAVQNTQTQEAIDNISSPELQNSLRYNTQYMEKAMQMNSIVPDDVMQAAKIARETIAEKFLDPEVQDALGLPPDVIGNTYIPNGSYDGTEENTTVCVRSMAVDALMDAVAEKLGRPLTVADTIAISQEYWKYTDSPECLYCYVAMDRKAYREYLGSYLKQRDDVIENIKNGMSRDEAYEKFLDGRKDTKQMQRRFSMWLTNYNKGVATITPADLASDANMQAAVERDKSLEVQINDARKYAQSASWAKKRISYRAYNNHILKWAKSRIDNLNKHYGLRMYSFSDYSPAFILENMQMITDAAVRGLKMLAYTKELDFVKIFAPTGMNINISVFGHQQNGMISQDAMQGADWKQAQDLRKEYGNVGITFVATNDEQVEWAMAQDWVDVVIPFHLVRTGAKVADYFGWKNYSGMQADVKTKAWKSGNATSIYPSEHHNDKAAYLAALEKNGLSPRFAQWLDNPNYMKLVNETRRSADETPIVQPVFDTDAALKSIETMRKKGGYYVPIGGTEEEMHDIATEIAENIDDVQNSLRVTPEQDAENEDTQYQLRNHVSTREALAGALMDITENDAERTRLERYIDGVEKIDAAQARVAELGKQIHDIMFTKDSDRSNLAALQAEKKNLESEIDRYDKMLIGLQSTKPLKALQERALARVNAEIRSTQRAGERTLESTTREYERKLEKSREALANAKTAKKEAVAKTTAELKAAKKEAVANAKAAGKEAVAKVTAGAKAAAQEYKQSQKELVNNYTKAFNSLARSDARQLAITAKQLARMTSKVESLERAKNKRETTAIRNNIKKTVDEWRAQLEDKAKGKHIPRQLVIAVADMVSVLDTTANTVSGLKKFTELQALYSQLKNDKDYKDAYDTSVAGMFDSLVEVIDDTPLSEMNYEQLSKVYDIVKAMKKTIAEARQTKSKEYKQNIFDTGKAIINEMIEASPSFKSKRLEAIHIWQLDPESFFVGELAGFKKDAVWGQIARSFTEGTKRATMVEMAHQNHFANFITSRDIRRLTNWKKTIDVGLVDMKTGEKVMLPRGAALGMYMHTLGEDNQLALIYGTLHVPGNWKTYYTGNAAESYGGEPIRVRTEGNAEAINNIKELGKKIDELKDNDDLTREEKQKLKEKYQNQQMEYEQQALGEIQAVRDRIYSQMTETEKRYVEAIQQWFDGPAKNFANEVTMELWDVKKAQVKNYWPMHRDKAFIQSGDIGASVEDVNLSNAGWLKQRVRSSAPIYLTDITYELDQSMRNLARFYGYAIAQRDFNKIYNVQLGSQNTSVKEQVNRFGTGPRKIGVSAETYIDNYIKDITGGRVTAGDSIISLVRRTHPRATLTGSIRVWFSQLASLPTAAAEVGWDSAAKGFAKGFAAAFSPKFKEELARKSPTYWQRYKGQGGMRELAEMKQGNTAIDRGWNAVTNLPVFSAIANGTQIFDCYATANEYFMAEEWVKKHRPGLKGEEFETAVMEKYDAIIHHTQPNYTPTERSDLLRDKREGYKFLTMYKTQANKNYNMLANALGKYRKYKSDFKNKKNGVTAADVKDATRGLANTVSAVLIGETLLFVLGRALANMILGHVRDYRDDDDEITAAAVAAGIGKEAVNSIAGIFAFGGQLSDALFFIFSKDHTYRGIEDSGLKTLSEGAEYTVKLIKAVADGDVDWADVERAIKSDSAMLGLPYNNLKTIYTGAVGWAKDISNHEFGTYEAFVTRSKKTNYTRLLKALEDGDVEKAESVRDELRENDPDIEDSEINSGVRSVIKDIWEDGDLTSDAAVKLMVDYTDMDADDAYWAVQKWYNKANAEDDEKYTNTDYYRLWQVIDNDGDAEAAMSELLEHGKDADQIAQDVRKHIKDAYTNGEITDTQARERMLKYGQHKENKQIVPYTKAEVDKLVNGWVTSNTLGWDYDDKETLYAKGEISKSELKTALVDIGGMTSEKADQRIEIMDWNKEGYAVENDKYDSIIGEYNKKLKPHGISKSIWYNYYIFESKTSGEVDANGKSIPYSKMRKLFEYIGNLNITSEQKMALARTYTDNESSIAKYKTW